MPELKFSNDLSKFNAMWNSVTDSNRDQILKII